MHHSKRLKTTLIITLIALQLVPFDSVLSAAKYVSKNVAHNTAVQAQNVPPKITLADTDWSSTDWNADIVLPQDLDAYNQKLSELVAKRQFADAKNLKKRTHKMYEVAAMKNFGVPAQIQSLVAAYTKNGTKPVSKKDELKAEIGKTGLIKKTVSNPSVTDQVDTSQIVDLRKVPAKKLDKLTPYKAPTDKAIIKKVEKLAPPLRRTKSPHEYTPFDVKKFSAPRKSKSVMDYLKEFIVPAAHAADTVPLIEYYDGIEKNAMDAALYYLSRQQNADGSFGTGNQFIVTAEVIDALSRFGRSDNDAFNGALTYFANYEPQNSQEKAIKIKFLHATTQNYDVLLGEVLASKNADGGYGIEAGYTSDPLTTLEVLDMLTTIQYNADNAPAQAIAYLLGQIANDGSMHFTGEGDVGYYLVNRALTSLYPYQDLSVGDGQDNVPVRPKVDAMLNFMRNTYDEENQKLLASDDAIDEAMTAQIFELHGVELNKQTLIKENLKSRQMSNGSFGNNVRSTIQAMNVLAQADLVIENVASQGALVNRAPANFVLTVHNKGYRNSRGTDLHVFIDNFNFTTLTNIEGQGVTINPNESVNVILGFQDTVSFLGQMNVKIFAEPSADINYDDNWKFADFVFAPPANNLPALPVYYTAQSWAIDGAPALKIEWAIKNDPNRSTYFIAWRQKGTQEWLASYFEGGEYNYFVGNWAEGVTYEVTVGVVAQDQITEVSFGDSTEVKTSSNPAGYTGTVSGYATVDNSHLEGSVIWMQGARNVDSDGNFAYSDIYNGSQIAYVSADQYENLKTKYEVLAGGSTADVRIFTHLKKDAVPPTIDNVWIQNNWIFRAKNNTEVTLTANGSDDIGIVEADFYYWDPSIQSWIFIGTGKRGQYDGAGIVFYQWYIPAEFHGDGYKLKAVLRDYRGNESLEKEWGPFMIVDGTPPKFTITAPNGGEIWPLGSTQTITWNTQTLNNVERVNLYLEATNISMDLDPNKINNTGSYSLAIPNDSSFEGKMKVKVVGSDPLNSTEGFDESDAEFTISDNSAPLKKPWGTPALITDLRDVSQGGDITRVAARYDHLGVLHVVYRYVIGNDESLIYEKEQNGAWTQPTVIYQANSQHGINDLKMEIDNNNNPFLVWDVSVDNCSMNAADIYSMYFDGNSWTQPQNVSSNDTFSRDPEIAVDEEGNMHMIWLDGSSNDAGCNVGGEDGIFYGMRTANGNWVPAQKVNIGMGAFGQKIATTVDGHKYIVYRDATGTALKYIIGNGDAWGDPVTITQDQGGIIDMDLVAGSANSLHLVHNEMYQGMIRISYNYYDGAAWSAFSEVASTPAVDGHTVELPRVAVDARGDPQVIFRYNRPGENGKNILVWTTKKNGLWREASGVSPEAQNIDSPAFDVSLSNAGNLAVVYRSNYSFRSELFANTADLSSDYDEPALPTNVKVETRPGAAAVRWNKYLNTDGDFDHFNLYRTTGTTTALSMLAPLAQIANVNQVEYLDTTAVIGTQYYYAITAVDHADNELKTAAWAGPITSSNPPAQSLIKDGDMELANLVNWRNWSVPTTPTEKTTVFAYSTKQSIHINATGTHAGIQQLNIPVKANKHYRYTFYYNLLSGAIETSLGIRTSNGDFEGKTISLLPTGGAWKLYTRDFTVPSTYTGDFRDIIRIRNGEGYIDNVSITGIPVISLVQDGNMEADNLNDWRDYGVPTVSTEKSAVQARSPKKSLHINTTTTTAGVQQLYIPLEAGKKYRFTFYYNIVKGTLIPRLGIGTSNSDFEGKIVLLSPTGGIWKQYSRDFTVPANFLRDFRLLAIIKNGEGYIDDVNIELLPN